MILNRRTLFGLLAAPAIVQLASIMPVRKPPLVFARPAVPASVGGDYLHSVVVEPHSLTPGAVRIRDGNGESLTVFAGGPVPSLVPFVVPLGVYSVNGQWSLEIDHNVGAWASVETFGGGSVVMSEQDWSPAFGRA